MHTIVPDSIFHCHFGLFLSSLLTICFPQIAQSPGPSSSLLFSSCFFRTNSLVFSMWQSVHKKPLIFHSSGGLYLCLSSLLQLAQCRVVFFANRRNADDEKFCIDAKYMLSSRKLALASKLLLLECLCRNRYAPCSWCGVVCQIWYISIQLKF